VGVSPAFNATPSQREQATSVARLPQREKLSAGFMGELQLAQRQNKADSVAPRLKPFTVTKRAERELNELKPCDGFGH
jgi:hypothetical protein